MNTLIDEKEKTAIIEIKESKKQKKALDIKMFIMLFIAILLILSIEWLYNTTGNLTIEQLIFHLKVPIEGTNTSMVWKYIIQVIPLSIVLTIIITTIVKKLAKIKILKHLDKIILLASIIFVLVRANVIGYVANQIMASKFIEENYVSVTEEDIVFPEEKNNLIYIFLESMESTYTDKENGGIYDDDYIKELRELAEENIHFSNTNKLGGAYQLTGTGWTIAGMVAQTSGMPLKISIEQNSYGKYDTFLPGVTTIGEILQENGYKNYLLLGSDASFGGRSNYFSQHGEYEIWDFNSAIEEGRMTKEDKVWWGYDDTDLFKYAKEQLLEISKNNEPFNFTMLTVDTHFTDGYKCSSCENKYDTQYANVIACSSKKITEFVEWIQSQEFYENTTVVISGDHLTMQMLEEHKISKNYERTVFNTIINPSSNLDISNVKTNDREFATIDMFPTTLAALGAKVKNERIGLGTNLFSEQKTLIEQYGYNVVNSEIEKKSRFYEKNFIYGK